MGGEKVCSKLQMERSKYGTWKSASTLMCVREWGRGGAGEELVTMRMAGWQETRQGENIKGRVSFADFNLYIKGNGEPLGLKGEGWPDETSVL